jgi:hypothetical protein
MWRKAASCEQAFSMRRLESLQQPGGLAALVHDVIIYDIPLAQDFKDIRYAAPVTHAA